MDTKHSVVKRRIGVILLTVFNFSVTCLLLAASESSEMSMAISYVILSLSILLYLIYFNERLISLFTLYFIGFSLFIGGRFWGMVISYDVGYNPFSYDFGITYSLHNWEQIRTFLFVYLALWCTFVGYVWSQSAMKTNKKSQHQLLSKITYNIFFWLLVLLVCIKLFTTINNIYRVFQNGYNALFVLGASDSHELPLSLIINLLTYSIFTILYSESYNNDRWNRFKLVFYLFIITELVGVLTGGRGGFIQIIMFLGWHLYRNRKFKLKYLLAASVVGLVLITGTNYLTRSTRFTEYSGSLLSEVTKTMYGQGITLMVYDLSTHYDITDYPVHSIIKILVPGWQVLAKFIAAPDILAPYDLSTSSYVMHKVAPDLYYNNFGIGWSSLSDFYIFSFSNLIFFIPINILFGLLLRKLECENCKFYPALCVLFALNLFMLPRTSISVLWSYSLGTIILYYISHTKLGVRSLAKYSDPI